MYPGLASHPQHQIAKSQMQYFGGMLSFTLKAGAEEAKRVINSLHVFTQATSLGGVESLIEHRARYPAESHLRPGLLRLSVGIEHVEDLWADLDGAIAVALSGVSGG